MAELHTFRTRSGHPIDTGLALFFAAPHSFTGDDVLELHGHGGPVVLELLLRRTLELGARAARAGRIHAACLPERQARPRPGRGHRRPDRQRLRASRARRVAVAAGEFSALVHELAERVLELRMWIEAAIDFPEEEIDFLADRALGARMQDLRQRFAELAETARQGALAARWPDGGHRRPTERRASRACSIVLRATKRRSSRPMPGTTRDVLRERIADRRSAAARARHGRPARSRRTTSRRKAFVARTTRSRAPIACLFVVDAADPAGRRRHRRRPAPPRRESTPTT